MLRPKYDFGQSVRLSESIVRLIRARQACLRRGQTGLILHNRLIMHFGFKFREMMVVACLLAHKQFSYFSASIHIRCRECGRLARLGYRHNHNEGYNASCNFDVVVVQYAAKTIYLGLGVGRYIRTKI